MLTLGKFREVTQHLPEDTPMVYAWTWAPVEHLAYGSYCGRGAPMMLIVGTTGSAPDWNDAAFHNETLYEESKHD